MNDNKIAFIICVLDEKQFETCISYINKLNVPSGFELEIVDIREKNNIAHAYNIGLGKTDAKYKVYIHSNTYIKNRNLIRDILDIFNNEKIGLIGVVGAKRIPPSGVWWNDISKVGKVNLRRNDNIEHCYKNNNIIEKYEIVEAVDGLIMSTQYDIKWKEEIFDSLYFYDISQCLEFKKKGFEVVVPRQEEAWCIHDESINVDDNPQRTIEKYRKVFLEEYPDIISRNICSTNDLFTFNKEEALKIINDNKKALESYVYSMKNYLVLKDYESLSRQAYAFATKASWNWNHPGFYQSPEVENMLLECADKLPIEKYVIKERSSNKRKVLHVLSEGYSTGGHTRLAKNWIKSDTNSIHSLVTTWQIGSAPQWLLNEIKKSGGWIFSLETVSNGYVDRAIKLRKLAYEWADIVVLHVHMMDPIPVMAFGVNGGPPIIYMNHGDHCLWLGASIADLVADFRSSGQNLTLTRRGCKNSCILPIPLEPPKTFNRNEVRRKYKINDNETVILTIASNNKFRSINNNNYISILKDIINKVDNCRVYIIGPRDAGKWHEANVEKGGRIKALGVLTEIEEFYQIADIYLDCFMIGSMTSLLDASKYGLPVIKFSNDHCSILTEYDEEFEACSYNKLDDIISEVNKIKNGDPETLKKHKKVTEATVKNHILDIKERIKNIYDRLDGEHRVNRALTISNEIEDYDLFQSILVSRGYIL